MLAAVIRGLDADQPRAMVGALTQVPQLAQAGDSKPTASRDSFAAMLHTARGLFQHQPSDRADASPASAGHIGGIGEVAAAAGGCGVGIDGSARTPLPVGVRCRSTEYASAR